MDKYKYAFLNGKFINEKNAKISISDLGLLRGYGVFDFTIADKDMPVHLIEHIERLGRSASAIGLKLPHSIDEIAEKTLLLLKKNKLNKSGIRWVLTKGLDENKNKPTFAIINQKHAPYPKSYYSEGVKLITAEFLRELPAAKTLNYQFAFSMHNKMRKAGAFEILYIKKGNVLECSTSNIFIVKDRVINTPKENILMGITRTDVIQLASKSGYKVCERNIRAEELLSADEIFITASGKKIMPVVEIDNSKIASGKPGKITEELIQLYRTNC